ncbi:lipid II:glycine glycyltransferase FemX [Azospirillum halopraeferens]|uniref:lipid II:glycine glycyltransferase FemX n=1 Tax=Azospirillum halopraeferens TaxID=34010 RepID=UPI00049087A4|nr:GNAT family N-acetyltransferase [Azospirillum halopraeferens]
MTAPSVRIVWNDGTLGDWSAAFARIERSTLTQCFGYARAMGRTHGHVPRLGMIERDGTPIGMLQVLERRALKLFVQRRLHRGPLWFDGPPEPAVLEAVLRLLRRECPDNPLSRLSFLPELPASDMTAELMVRCGFRKVGPGYRTVWIDLTRSDEELGAALSRGWRQALKGARKAGLTLDLDPEAKNLPWLVKQEHDQARVKQYREMSGPLVVRLRNALHTDDGVLMTAALKGGKPVSSALFLGHGTTATYQLGWSDDVGRKTSAMRLVLWESMGALRQRGFRWLDLGGINPDTAPGVTEFKLGTGGEATETVGLYR